MIGRSIIDVAIDTTMMLKVTAHRDSLRICVFTNSVILLASSIIIVGDTNEQHVYTGIPQMDLYLSYLCIHSIIKHKHLHSP